MTDHSTDYQFWDNPEAIVVTTTVGGSATTTSVSTAVQKDISRSRGTFAGISLQGDELGWLVPVALMSGREINIGDFLTQTDNTVWRVVGAVKRGIGSNDTHWELATRKGV